MKKKTVVEVTGALNFGGAEMMQLNIFRKLHREFNFIFLVNEVKGKRVKGDFDDEILNKGGRIEYIDSLMSSGIKNYEKNLADFFNKEKPDVVHCHLNAKCGTVSKVAKKCGIKKIISHSHAKLVFRGNPIKVMLYKLELIYQRRLINKYSTDFWGCSKDALYSLYNKKNIASNKCKVISNLIDCERFTAENNEKVTDIKKELNINSGLTLGLVGRIAPVKNYEFAVEVANELKSRNFDFNMFIFGNAQSKEYYEFLIDKIKTYNLQDNIKIFPAKADIENYYKVFDIYLGTSHQEGFSITAAEAQVSGCYSLISNGYPEEIIFSENFGIQLPLDVKVWADEIEKFKGKRIDVETCKKALISKGFDLDTEIKKIGAEYDS